MLEANKLFEEVLARRDRADATRNALGVLQRFKFLFSLPVSIERNIRKGDYDVVINDYARAKNLFGKTDVPVRISLGKVSFRHHYPKRISADDFLAAYLQRLDSPLAGKTPRSTPQSNNKFGSKTPVSQDWQSSVPQRVLFVEELSEITTNMFPDLWKLGQAYFSGELHVKVEPEKQTHFKRMVLAPIELLSGLLRAAILPHTLDRMSPLRTSYGMWPPQGLDGVGPWLPHCLRYIRSTYTSLIRLDLPNEALTIIASLIFDLRLHCMSTLFQQAAEHIKCLHKKETWHIEFDTKHSGITQLPSEFENKVQEVVQMVKESVLLGGHRESPLLDNANAQRELNALIQGLLLSFTQALDTLAFSNDGMQNESSAVSQLIGSPAIYRGNEGSGPGWEQRLLTTLSNSQYTAKVVLPRLSEVFSRHDYPPLTLPVATATSALSALDRQILEVYLEQKSDPLVGTIEPSMYLGRFDWDTTRRPTDVQPYIKEIITNMIGVHAEVHHVNPNLVSRVLSQIVETVAEELSRLMSCVTRFSIQGNQQARVDIRAVQETVSLYTTPTAQLVEDLLAKFRVRMRLQLMCFGDMKIVSSGQGI
uniref:Exocyst complex component 2 n=1 Tax=Timema californicum TaxID=61474 RepID=A0A7R9J3J5_TIMCA|nr:unnamed protein product [Timema californicum]